ncbi:hypothetical protein B0H67DRAFT_345126 [Lasiosphaeris hirsuta]|uniref:Uncharacterized protein n=1 Tax=Lasiosphaeris hirsuta TaxID=260670 RepID=A0AA40A3I1_9PEZI|nr:hypothetical protein B0H67DRAFT_345126 [Lasiosphaeris hirsuta]
MNKMKSFSFVLLSVPLAVLLPPLPSENLFPLTLFLFPLSLVPSIFSFSHPTTHSCFLFPSWPTFPPPLSSPFNSGFDDPPLPSPFPTRPPAFFRHVPLTRQPRFSVDLSITHAGVF